MRAVNGRVRRAKLHKDSDQSEAQQALPARPRLLGRLTFGSRADVAKGKGDA